MIWIRNHKRFGAWLALTALAIHAVLTFGHVHAERFLAPLAAAEAATANKDTARFFAIDIEADEVRAIDVAAADERGGPGMPVRPQRPPLIRDFCAVCANINLLGTLLLPVAQVLAPPPAILRINRDVLAAAVAPRERFSSSRARAPPSA